MQWLRRSLIAGFVVIVPLVISVAAFVWLFQFIDGVMGPVYVRWIGREIPGFGLATLLLLVVAVGTFATNVLGARLLRRGEAYLMKLPVFRGIYSPVKQLVEAFSPDNELSFKRVVLVDDPKRGLVLGFLTKEFTIEGQEDAGVHVAVYVPTNHVYFGRRAHLSARGRILPRADRAGGAAGVPHGRHGAGRTPAGRETTGREREAAGLRGPSLPAARRTCNGGGRAPPCGRGLNGAATLLPVGVRDAGRGGRPSRSF